MQQVESSEQAARFVPFMGAQPFRWAGAIRHPADRRGRVGPSDRTGTFHPPFLNLHLFICREALSDARACLIRTFANVVRDDALGLAIQLLMQAAETGKPKDHRAATDQIELILRSRGVLANGPRAGNDSRPCMGWSVAGAWRLLSSIRRERSERLLAQAWGISLAVLRSLDGGPRQRAGN
jgi:hypothetical protein